MYSLDVEREALLVRKSFRANFADIISFLLVYALIVKFQGTLLRPDVIKLFAA